MKKKQSYIYCLALLLVGALISCMDAKERDARNGKIFKFDEETRTIYGVQPEYLDEEKFVIPDEIEGIKVKAVSRVLERGGYLDNKRSVFYNCPKLKEIVISEGVEVIRGAFIGCTGLTKVILPKGIKNICEAFVGCAGLVQISVPDGVIDMRGAFTNCRSLKEVNIPNNVADLLSTFEGCANLTNIIIPETVTSLNRAFSGCTNLKSIVIPGGVTDLKFAFIGCTKLTHLIIPESVTDISGAFDKIENLVLVMKSPIPIKMAWRFNGFFSNPKSLGIYVPNIALDAYKSEGGWEDYAANIFPIEELKKDQPALNVN